MYSFTLGKCGLCEVIHSALPVLTVLSLGPMGQTRGLRGSLLGPRSGWANASLSTLPFLPRNYFLTPSMGKFWIAWKQICQNLSGMWEDVTRKVWQLEVWRQGIGPYRLYQRVIRDLETFLGLRVVSTLHPWPHFSDWFTHSLIRVALLSWFFFCYVGTFASISPINPFPV